MSSPRTPNVREAAGRGVPGKGDSADLVDPEHAQEGNAPRTSGAPQRGKEPLPNKLADRNDNGPRQAGETPRPTAKPIVGGSHD